jgi:hypothetical protein
MSRKDDSHEIEGAIPIESCKIESQELGTTIADLGIAQSFFRLATSWAPRISTCPLEVILIKRELTVTHPTGLDVLMSFKQKSIQREKLNCYF